MPRDASGKSEVRKLVAGLVAPGQEGDPGLPDEARFRYQEWWGGEGRLVLVGGTNYSGDSFSAESEA